MGDIILVIIILIIASGLLRRLLLFALQKYFQKMARDLSRRQQHSAPQSNNQRSFWTNSKPKSSGNDNTGEYVDYEEIK